MSQASYPLVYKLGVKIRLPLVFGALITIAILADLIRKDVNSHNPIFQDRTFYVFMFLFVVSAISFACTVIPRVIISEDRVKKINVFGTKELLIVDIKGYRKTTSHGQFATTSYTLIGRASEADHLVVDSSFNLDDRFLAWVVKFENLDSADQKAAEQEVAIDARFGSSPERRIAKWRRAESTAVALLYVPILLLLCEWVASRAGYRVTFILWFNLVYPIFIIALVALSDGIFGLFEADPVERRVKQDLTWALIGSCVFSGIFVTDDASEFPIPADSSELWLPGIAIGAALVLVIVLTARIKKKNFIWLLGSGAVLSYYGGIVYGLVLEKVGKLV